MRTPSVPYLPGDDRAFALAAALDFRRIPAGGFAATQHQIRRLLRLHRSGFTGTGLGSFRAAGKTMGAEEAIRECCVLERRGLV